MGKDLSPKRCQLLFSTNSKDIEFLELPLVHLAILHDSRRCHASARKPGLHCRTVVELCIRVPLSPERKILHSSGAE